MKSLNIKKAKLFGTIIGVILFIILAAGLTYAWFTWRSDNIIISGNTSCFTINYEKGQNIVGTNLKLFDEADIIASNSMTLKSGMALTSVRVGIDSSCTATGYININLNVDTLDSSYMTDGDSTGALKYAILEYSSSTYPTVDIESLAEQSFNIVKKESITTIGEINAYSVQLPNYGTKKEYLIVFYIDGDLALNNSQGASFTGSINAIVNQGTLSAS